MGQCIYCGKGAGFLRKQHQECKQKHNQAWDEMVALASDTALGQGDVGALESQLTETAREGYIPATRTREAMIAGWRVAIENALDDHLLSAEEEDRLTAYVHQFNLSQKELDSEGAFTRMIQAAVIRDAQNGVMTTRVSLQGHPFNFQKSETLAWIFQNVEYYEQKVRRERQGNYGGISFRVAKGVYYRTGGFRSRPLEHTVTEHVDSGLLGVTTKHIYFSGSNKKFRIPYSRIVAFDPYSDGIGITRDSASAMPQTFKIEDGWFIYNLVTALAQS